MPREKKPVRTSTLGEVLRQHNHYRARYIRHGKTHTPGHTFTSFVLADRWLRAEQDLIEADAWTPPAARRAAAAAEEDRHALTLRQYAQDWIEQRITPKGTPLHPRTAGEYRAYLNGILDPLAAKPLTSITLDVVAKWHQQHAATPVLRARAYAFLKSVFKTAVAHNVIESNPCTVENADRKVRPKVDADKIVRPITHAKIVELANLVRPRDRLLILLEAYCCLRTGEACALRRPDITMGETLGVPHAWVTVERGISTYQGDRHEGGVKTGHQGERIVPVPPHLIDDIAEHLDRWAEPGNTGLLFPSTNSRMQFRTTQQINGHAAVVDRKGAVRKAGTGWYHARIEAGVPALRLHHLRHWGATLWDEAGTPEAIRRAILGHAQPGMTGHYTHPDTTKASPYATKVSELAGWTPPSPRPAADGWGPALAALDDEALVTMLGALDPERLSAMLPHLPAERIAVVLTTLARTTKPKKGGN